MSHPEFGEVVERSWKEGGLEGWGSFILKEKLKRLKLVLKEWNSRKFGAMEQNIKDLRKEVKRLDERDDEEGITEVEAMARSEALAKLFHQLHNRKSLLAQKAKLSWLREGDVNSKMFHKAINNRRMRNGLLGLEVEGEWVEDPVRVKGAVRDHFQKLFQKRVGEKAWLGESFEFPQLDDIDENFLTRPFEEEEVKNAVWSAMAQKTQGRTDST